MTAAEAEERARLEAVKACVQRTLHALEARLDGVAQDATIQRDQNAIIRNEHAQVLIIQGVAGSGKTSIALHRIAFLLYRFKDTLTSRDMLVISPNRVFADYISNVLPEPGDESVSEIGMETLAEELLGYAYRFQAFFEQTAVLLEMNDEALQQRIALKASPDFLATLGEYAEHVESNMFTAQLHMAKGLGVRPGHRARREPEELQHGDG